MHHKQLLILSPSPSNAIHIPQKVSLQMFSVVWALLPTSTSGRSENHGRCSRCKSSRWAPVSTWVQISQIQQEEDTLWISNILTGKNHVSSLLETQRKQHRDQSYTHTRFGASHSLHQTSDAHCASPGNEQQDCKLQLATRTSAAELFNERQETHLRLSALGLNQPFSCRYQKISSKVT